MKFQDTLNELAKGKGKEKEPEQKKAPNFRKLPVRECCDECKFNGETNGRCFKYDFYPQPAANSVCDSFTKPTGLRDRADRG